LSLMNSSAILNCIKPTGLSSTDCIKLLKRYGPRKMKIGHGGTLDPFASGVLPVGINKGTKLLQSFLEGEKSYRGEVKAGYSTHTLDLEGNLKSYTPDQKVERELLLTSNFLEFIPGKYMQRTPLFSARRVNGKRLYKKARQMERDRTESVQNLEELPRREVTIHSFSVSEISSDRFSFEITCSKGTYVRQFIQDLANSLCLNFTLERLERTRVANLSIENGVELSELISRLWWERVKIDTMQSSELLSGAVWLHKVKT